jgi:glutamate racemase
MRHSTDSGAEPSEIRPIGVFDSGIGGLTVAAAIRRHLPTEDIFYLGDTARVPYGGKSRQTIERYSLEISGLLLAENAKLIVVACNTASALALDRLEKSLRVPVLGVVTPGAEAAAASSRNGRIGVIGTRATIASGAYEQAIRRRRPAAQIFSAACPLLVPLIEEGWLDDPITTAVLERCLAPLLREKIDTLVLGCTHYPLARAAITQVVGPEVALVDSAENCARAVVALLNHNGMAQAQERSGRWQIALTDPAGTFLRVAEDALQLPPSKIELRTVQGVLLG